MRSECGVYDVVAQGKTRVGLIRRCVLYATKQKMERVAGEKGPIEVTEIEVVRRRKDGKMLLENCEVFDCIKLGSGGQGKLYLGLYEGPEGKYPVAVKTNKLESYLQQEIDILKHLQECRNIVGLVTTGPNFAVMELADRTLYDELVEAKTGLPDAKVRGYLKDLLEGVQFMHSRGYIHKDLKSENLLLFGNTLKISDFGVSTKVRAETSSSEGVSFRYAGPERFGVHTTDTNYTVLYDVYTDIFSVGAVLLEMVMGFSNVKVNDEGTIVFGPNEPAIDESSPFKSIIAEAMHEESCLRPSAQELLDMLENTTHPCPEQSIVVYCMPVPHVWRHHDGKWCMKGYELGKERQVTPNDAPDPSEFPWRLSHILPSVYNYMNHDDPDMKMLANGGQCYETMGHTIVAAFSFTCGEDTRLSFTLDPSCSVPYTHDKDTEYGLHVIKDMKTSKIGDSDARFLVPVASDKVLLLYGETPVTPHASDRMYSITYANAANAVGLMLRQARWEAITTGSMEVAPPILGQHFANIVTAAREGHDERLFSDVGAVMALIVAHAAESDAQVHRNIFDSVEDIVSAKRLDPTTDSGNFAVGASELVKFYRQGKLTPPSTLNVVLDSFETAALKNSAINDPITDPISNLKAYVEGDIPLPFVAEEGGENHQALWTNVNALLVLYVENQLKAVPFKWKECRDVLCKLQTVGPSIMQHFVRHICYMEAGDDTLPVNELFPDKKPSFLRWRHMMDAPYEGVSVVNPVNPQVSRADGRRYMGHVEWARVVMGKEQNGAMYAPYSSALVQGTEVDGDMLVVTDGVGVSRLWFRTGSNKGRTRKEVLDTYHGYDKVNVLSDMLLAHGLDLAIVASPAYFIAVGDKTLEVCRQFEEGELRSSKVANALAGIAILNLYCGIGFREIHMYPAVHRIQYTPFKKGADGALKITFTAVDVELAKFLACMAFLILSHRRYNLMSIYEIQQAREEMRGKKNRMEPGGYDVASEFAAFEQRLNSFFNDLNAKMVLAA